MTAVGGSLGPVIVAWLTDSVFHDEHKIGYSMAILGVSTALLALGLLLLALKPLRLALSQSPSLAESLELSPGEAAPAIP